MQIMRCAAAIGTSIDSFIGTGFVFRAKTFRLPLAVAGGIAIFGAFGCRQDGDEGNRVPVAGKVTFKDGKPLTRGVVIFAPDGAKGNASQHEPRGMIDGEGNYTIATTPSLKGVIPGWYLVTIIAQEPYDESKSSWDPPWLINRKYGNRQTSGLTAEVVEKPEPGRYDFQVSK
jgi:hypothetical protein